MRWQAHKLHPTAVKTRPQPEREYNTPATGLAFLSAPGPRSRARPFPPAPWCSATSGTCTSTSTRTGAPHYGATRLDDVGGCHRRKLPAPQRTGTGTTSPRPSPRPPAPPRTLGARRAQATQPAYPTGSHRPQRPPGTPSRWQPAPTGTTLLKKRLYWRAGNEPDLWSWKA